MGRAESLHYAALLGNISHVLRPIAQDIPQQSANLSAAHRHAERRRQAAWLLTSSCAHLPPLTGTAPENPLVLLFFDGAE